MPKAPSPDFGRPPDARMEVRDASGCVQARCSLWWQDPLVVLGRRAGLIGQFAATTAAAGVDMLEQACRELTRHDCALAIGPMDGTTWGNYRFVTGGTGEPTFFLEPDHPPEWPAYFVTSGFVSLARYHSTVTEDLDGPDPKADRAEERLRETGCVIRTLDSSRLNDEMVSIFRLSLAAFHNAFLYRPISFEEFAASHEKLTPFLRPELVLMAEREGDAVGFVFALPDHLQVRRGAPVDTVIIKTLAVLPGRELAGLGVCLVRLLHRAAKTLGYRRVIHALMHESNRSLNIHRNSSRPLREYTLFAKKL